MAFRSRRARGGAPIFGIRERGPAVGRLIGGSMSSGWLSCMARFPQAGPAADVLGCRGRVGGGVGGSPYRRSATSQRSGQSPAGHGRTRSPRRPAYLADPPAGTGHPSPPADRPGIPQPSPGLRLTPLDQAPRHRARRAIALSTCGNAEGGSVNRAMPASGGFACGPFRLTRPCSASSTAGPGPGSSTRSVMSFAAPSGCAPARKPSHSEAHLTIAVITPMSRR
jgi:hypothetical protein